MRRWPAILALPLLLAACACPPLPNPEADADAWFVEVEREGGCWLGPETLRRMGIDPGGASPGGETPPTLRLSWDGQEIPHLAVRTDAGWGAFFFAADRATRYTRRTAFRLQVGTTGAAIPLGEAAVGDTAAAPTGGLVTLHREEDLRYLPQAATETPWLWEPIYAPGELQHTLALTDAVAGPLTATLHLWSHTAVPAAPDHLLRLKWDGRTVGEWEWDGQGMQHLTASWDEERPEVSHTLAVETPALPGVDVAMVWLDGWDITYRRQVKADGSTWQAEGSALQVAEVEPDMRLLDVTDPLAPRDLGPIPADGVVSTVPGHRYWAGVPQEAPGPLAVRPARQIGSLDSPSYLAIAPLAFHAPLQPLLEHRRSQGLETAVVDIQAVYDTYGNGQPDPAAIHALVQSLPDLRYLLLVGDGTAEPAGYDDQAGALRVVVPLTRTAVLGETPADGILGVNGEGQATVAVGRLPAASVDEVQAMVAKTLQWESRQGPPTALLLNDNATEFAVAMEEIAALIPEGVPVQRLDAGDAQSREQALDALGQGPTWLNYTGHGSLTILCREGVLKHEDGEAWQDPALVVAWTCLAAHFIHPSQTSMGEAWLRAPRGGAVAFLGPVGETTTGDQVPFARTFYRALAQGERLGDAWLAAFNAGGARDVAWGYTLLGDPALRLTSD